MKPKFTIIEARGDWYMIEFRICEPWRATKSKNKHATWEV